MGTEELNKSLVTGKIISIVAQHVSVTAGANTMYKEKLHGGFLAIVEI
jgi:hypothetical protein